MSSSQDDTAKEIVVGIFKLIVGFVMLIIGGIAALLKFQYDRNKDSKRANLLEAPRNHVAPLKADRSGYIVGSIICIGAVIIKGLAGTVTTISKEYHIYHIVSIVIGGLGLSVLLFTFIHSKTSSRQTSTPATSPQRPPALS
jgi:drug/metabolite transporter (DMT)-like permease